MLFGRDNRTAVLLLIVLLALPAMAIGGVAEDGDGDGGGDRLNDGFRSLPEVEAQLRSLAENNSDIAVLYDLGELYPNGDGSTKTSHEGRHFYALKISDNPQIDESDEPDVLYVGTHHAREWMAVEMMMWLIEHILADYGTNATITDIVDNKELWLWPVLNPDGFFYTETDRTWRKNRRDNGDGTFGVDPNRNYGYAFAYDNIGSSPQTSQETYRGPSAFSEPCTQVMRDLAYDVGFVGSISFHTHSEVMGFPYSYTSRHAEHYPIFRELGARMAAHNGYEYGDIRDGILYEVNGGMDDFMYHNTSCIAFTYEMNSLAQGGFYVDASYIEPTCTMNYEAALEMAKAAGDWYGMFDAGVNATVVDPRGDPVENASVRVLLLGEDSLDFTTGPDGRFSFNAPYEYSYSIAVQKEGYSKYSESVAVLWRDRLTEVTITIRDNVPPVIARVEASHEGEVGTSFGIGQDVRLDVFEGSNEPGLEGVVTVQSVQGQYFHRRKVLTYDGGTGSYYYVWNTSGLKPRSDYMVTTELWDIDGNKDKDGVVAGQPDLTIELRDITPPMAPMNLTAELLPEGGALRLRWLPNADDTEAYTLERRLDPGGDWTFLINLTRKETEFTDQGLTNDVQYSYRLMAWDKVPLPSQWSEPVSATPRDVVPPGGVVGLVVSAPHEGRRLELTWTESTDDTAWYIVLRDDGPGFEEVGRVRRGVTSFSDGDLENARTYLYRLRAQDASGNEGPESLPVLGLPQDLIPPDMPLVGPLPELTNQREHGVSGTAEPNATVVVVVDKAEAITLPVGADGRFSGTLTLENGVRRVQFKTVDPALNPSALTEEAIVQVDLNPPYVVSSTPVPDQKGVRVGEWIGVSISEALVEGTLQVRLLFSRTGVEVSSSFEYAAVAKTITLYPTTELEKGTGYRVEVNGTDAAGNYLVDGSFEFTTVEEKVQGPPISTGGLVGILLLIVIIAVAAVLAMRYLRRPEDEGAPGGPSPAPEVDEPVEAELYHEEHRPFGGVYDPRPEDTQETTVPEGWEEY